MRAALHTPRLRSCGRQVLTAAVAAVVVACGGGDELVPTLLPSELEPISGKVIDGYVADALVCMDINANGYCDALDPSARTDAAGTYALLAPKGYDGALVAEITAGQSRMAGGAAFGASFRMVSPARSYSADITPYTTLVHLTGVKDHALAEALVRDIVGLPPRYPINVDFGAEPDSMTFKVAAAVSEALQATSRTLGSAAPYTMRQVVAQFPARLKALPVLRIATKDRAPIVSKEDYVDATFQLTNPVVSEQAIELNGKIRGRGHSTWGQPKNPYKVQFANDASYAAIGDVLGMAKNRNWALLADYFDKTLMRNKLAFSLGNSSLFNEGLKWTPSAQNVEVFLNDDYVGLYLLTEDIRLDPSRVSIRKMGKTDVDGGYIVEADTRLDCYNGGDINLQHRTPYGGLACIDTPDEDAITAQQQAYIKNYLDAVEADIFGPSGLRSINRKSFADWYLLSEFLKNPDSQFFSTVYPYYSSVFMWKGADTAAEPEDRVLNLGPLWDFDLAAGNHSATPEVAGCWISRSSWMAKLFENPEFLALTLSRWKEKRPGIEAFVNTSIGTYVERQRSAQERNFQRWPVFGVPLFLGDPYLLPSYESQVDFLKDYLYQRMLWLDQAFATPESFRRMCR